MGRGRGGGGGGGRHYLHCERVVFEEKLVFLGEGFTVCAAAEAPEHGFRGRLAGQADESVGGSDNPPACESTRVLGFVLFCFVFAGGLKCKAGQRAGTWRAWCRRRGGRVCRWCGRPEGGLRNNIGQCMQTQARTSMRRMTECSSSFKWPIFRTLLNGVRLETQMRG